jgi:NADH-quinone oxidoreductase subunit B
LSRQAFVVTGGRAYRLNVLNVGLACCAVEALVAAVADGGGDLVLTDSPVEVVVVSGTVTDKLAPLVRRLYDDLPGPVKVVAYGACASSGGPYWDSYCVTRGAHLVVPVDVWVPGCPPRPEALLAALATL